MKSQMFSVIHESRHHELRALFAEYPFGEMNRRFAEEQGCIGIALECGEIYILPQRDPRDTLMAYLHEISHITLLRAGYRNWDLHDDAFVQIARELQARFGVASRAEHGYDQQDARVKTSAEKAERIAMAATLAAEYDPTGRAVHHAMTAVQTERRHLFQWAGVMIGFSITVIVSFTIDWSSVLSTLDQRDLILVSGAAVALWLWWNFGRNS